MSSHRTRSRAWLVFAVALTLRLALFVWVTANGLLPDRTKDHAHYAHLAQNLLAGKGFTCDGQPESVRIIGYPAFISTCLALSGGWPYSPLLVQCVVSALTAAVIVPLCDRTGMGRWGLTAGLLYAVHPTSILYANILLADSLFAFFVGLSLYWLLRDAASSGVCAGARAAAGLLLGVSGLLKPAALLIVPGVIVAMGLTDRCRGVQPRQAVLSLAGFCAAFCVVLLPWAARNRVVFGTFQLTSQAGRDLLMIQAAGIESRARHVTRAQVRAEYAKRVSDRGPFATDFERSRTQMRMGFGVVRRHPGGALHAALVGPGNVYSVPLRGHWALVVSDREATPVGLVDNVVGFRQWDRLLTLPGAAPALAEMVLSVVLMVVALRGLIRLVRAPSLRCVSVYVISVPLLYGLLMGYYHGTRYGLPMLLPFCIAAVVGCGRAQPASTSANRCAS